jgi:DNA-binding MarR family transcriptional regulator
MSNSPLRSIALCDCLAIRQAARQITQLYDRYLSREGLGANQYAILRKLSGFEGLSISQLALSMVMDATSVSRAIKPLVRDGLISISTDQDARTRKLELTEVGRARLKSATVLWQRAQDEFEAAFGQEEAQHLRHTMWRVVESSKTPE